MIFRFTRLFFVCELDVLRLSFLWQRLLFFYVPLDMGFQLFFILSWSVNPSFKCACSFKNLKACSSILVCHFHFLRVYLCLYFSILLSVCDWLKFGIVLLYQLGVLRQMQTLMQLLDEVVAMTRIIKILVRDISRIRRLRLKTLTEFLIIRGIIKTESDNCLIKHCTKTEQWKSCFASSLTASNTKRANLTWYTFWNRAPRSCVTWLPVTLSVFDMIIV